MLTRSKLKKMKEQKELIFKIPSKLIQAIVENEKDFVFECSKCKTTTGQHEANCTINNFNSF